jgi:transposase
MGRKRKEEPDRDKVETLRRYHALNPHPEKVKDEVFIKGAPFFDARDLVQVKYEMLRRVREESLSVTEAAASFGFSRPSFYHAKAAFERGGLGGILPEHPGPKRAHKLTEEVMDFIEEAIERAGPLSSDDLASMIGEEFGISVHPRSVERAISRRKKNS